MMNNEESFDRDEFDDEEMLAYYMVIGVIELAGVDESGEFIFKITEDAAELAPELWQAHTDYLDRTLVELYEKGYVDITYDDELNAHFQISEEGKEVARAMGLIESDFDEDIPND